METVVWRSISNHWMVYLSNQEAKTSGFGLYSGDTMKDQFRCTYLDVDSRTSPWDPKISFTFRFFDILVNFWDWQNITQKLLLYIYEGPKTCWKAIWVELETVACWSTFNHSVFGSKNTTAKSEVFFHTARQISSIGVDCEGCSSARHVAFRWVSRSAHLVKTNELCERGVRDLIGAEELIAAVWGVDEEMLAAVVAAERDGVAPDALTDANQERADLRLLQQVLRLLPRYNTCQQKVLPCQRICQW